MALFWQLAHFLNSHHSSFRCQSIFRSMQDHPARKGSWLSSRDLAVTLLHALEMTFHMWRRSLMTFILRGRRSIWWGWRVTLLAPRIGNDVSQVTLHALEMTFHMWRRSLMTFILRGRRSIWWGWWVTFRGRRSTSWRMALQLPERPADTACLLETLHVD